MPKKSSSKKLSETLENRVDQEKNVSPIRKKAGNEIDEIFSKKKRKKPEKSETKKSNEDVNVKKKKKRKSGVYEEGGLADQPCQPKRRTNDGLSIYTEEELGLNKADAGGTNLCPFDCSCCF